MSLLISLLGIFITVFFVIGTHEAAHFAAARLLGVKVLRFSIGFGKTLLQRRDSKGTEYVLALIPLGGYVKMLDESEGPVPQQDLSRAFNRQPFYKKFLIVLAGPIANLVCAFILYWIIFMIGFTTLRPIIGEVSPDSIAAKSGLKSHQEIIRIDNQPTLTWTSIVFRLLVRLGDTAPLKIETINPTTQQTQVQWLNLRDWQLNELAPDPLTSLGITPYHPDFPLIIDVIAKHSPAAAVFQPGDKIIALNQAPLKNWEKLFTIITHNPGKTLTFTIERQGKQLTLPVTLDSNHHFFKDSTGYLGIGPKVIWPKNLLHRIQYPPLSAFFHAGQELRDFCYFNYLIFVKLVTGKLSLHSLGGPIAIFQSAGDALNYGLLPFISFLAFLSISIGVINLLPIPGLDGGHLLIQTIEWIFRRPLPIQLLSTLYYMGFLLILFIFIQALVNDLLRLY